MLQSFLFEIKDHRRKQGMRYQQGHILLFTVFAILSGAISYRKVHQFIVVHYDELHKIFDLNWKRMPAYTTIRDIIQKTSTTELEQSFRKYSASNNGTAIAAPSKPANGLKNVTLDYGRVNRF